LSIDPLPMMLPLLELVGARMRLRPIGAADETLYCGVYTDVDLMRQVASPLSWSEAQRAFALAIRANLDAHSRGRYWVISAFGFDVGLLGVTGTLLAADQLQCEVGAIVLRAWQGQGLAAAAIALLADHVFGSSSVARLHTRHAGNNGSAGGLMRKLGFTAVAAEVDAPLGYRWQLTRQSWRQRGGLAASISVPGTA
jgi:RimJ/RimL family protein N-acetyltransferase